MILTVSPNVALDRIRVTRGFHSGKQSRALFEFLQPGGSGVHATSVIQSLGGKSLALGFLGGHTGELWKLEADQHGLHHDMISIPNETRESFCLVDLDLGSVVESVVEGPHIPPNFKDLLLARIESYLPNAEMVILSGSSPPGLPIELYSEIIQLAKHQNIRTLADIHSEPLQHAIRVKPWMIKPNLFEYHILIGKKTHNLSQRIRASSDFCRETGIILALSMAEEGLLLTSPNEQWLLTPPSIGMYLPDSLGQNVIGCGDALVGALVYEYCRSGNLLDAARLGLAAAHFNLSTFGVPEINAEQVKDLALHVQLHHIK